MLWRIKDIDLHVEEVTGRTKPLTWWWGIFNRVNSGGTKLSRVIWPGPNLRRVARPGEMKALAAWERAGFSFNLEWLLRNITAILTGEALFSVLRGYSDEFRAGLAQAQTPTTTC